MPDSVEAVFAHVSARPDSDQIHVVHCYSMRNGLYGKPSEARLFWTQIALGEREDYRVRGHAENTRAIRIAIGTKIENFAVWDSDLTAFVMSHSQVDNSVVTLRIVPGPDAVAGRPVRTLTFKSSQ